MASFEFEEKLLQIAYRLKKREVTDEDITDLYQWLQVGNPQLSLQLGKFNVNVGEGREIHIGDRIYNQWDREAVQALMQLVEGNQQAIEALLKTLQELRKQTSTESLSLGSQLLATLNNIKFQGKEGEQGGTGSFYMYEIYLKDVILENEKNKDINQLYKLTGKWLSSVYKYVYLFDKVVDTPWGHHKKPYGNFEVVVKTINGVLDWVQVKANRYNDGANNYAANKVEQLIESKIREGKHKS